MRYKHIIKFCRRRTHTNKCLGYIVVIEKKVPLLNTCFRALRVQLLPYQTFSFLGYCICLFIYLSAETEEDSVIPKYVTNHVVAYKEEHICVTSLEQWYHGSQSYSRHGSVPDFLCCVVLCVYRLSDAPISLPRVLENNSTVIVLDRIGTGSWPDPFMQKKNKVPGK
jgi:hypothetical protein